MANELKLYVWTRFCPDYSGGLAFAIAENETQAKKLIEKQRVGFAFYEWGELHIHKIRKIAYCVSGGG